MPSTQSTLYCTDDNTANGRKRERINASVDRSKLVVQSSYYLCPARKYPSDAACTMPWRPSIQIPASFAWCHQLRRPSGRQSMTNLSLLKPSCRLPLSLAKDGGRRLPLLLLHLENGLTICFGLKLLLESSPSLLSKALQGLTLGTLRHDGYSGGEKSDGRSFGWK
jgi:hypothetical protein